MFHHALGMDPFRSRESRSREPEREYEGGGAWQEYERARTVGGFGITVTTAEGVGASTGGGEGRAVWRRRRLGDMITEADSFDDVGMSPHLFASAVMVFRGMAA